MKEKLFVALIPSRLNSRRIKQKPLLKINGIPIIAHTYMRSCISKIPTDNIFVCTDSDKIVKAVKKFRPDAKCILTSKKHKNGTERIAEAAKNINTKYIIDIQGDEPLLNPNDINELMDFHKSHSHFDIVVPHIKIKKPGDSSIVKIVKDKNNKVLYFSRSEIPHGFKNKPNSYLKHLSIISFKNKALKLYSKFKMTKLEKNEDIELLRALENGMNIGTFQARGSSFAVDTIKQYHEAILRYENDIFFKIYKPKNL